MLKVRQDHATLVILTDIFGLTEAVRRLTGSLANGQPYLIIDPYQQQMMRFDCEAQAYQYFSKQVGVDNYLTIAQQHLRQISKVDKVIGFSVGGSVLWRLLSDGVFFQAEHDSICFYPSQVRHYLDLSPQSRCRIYLPNAEPHFCVNELFANLKSRPNVLVEQTPYFHGFMNEVSDNFDSDAYQAFIQKLST
ncbi:dienelactone hydrolase family protein [Thalassotalea sp. G2M2-11]|uniref:dienelactone hydrolase family protein n=1 Tax=Thalassotalea sp. G2M2-11 TaxID=2787627 RepID=UPI0019D063B1|nr:dienelactone hydrolase family protein [Thalassotalea sp. G2M2-11]